MGNKIVGAKMPYPLVLNITPFLDIEVDQGDPHIYDLYGVVVHFGYSTHGGHYQAYVRGETKNSPWYECDDESIRKVNGDTVLGQEAYQLFYQKRMTKE